MERTTEKLRAAVAWVLLVSLLLGMLVCPAAADEARLFLSELRICIAPTWEEAASILQSDGYTVVAQDLNAGTGDGALSVCLGYKTTTDPEQALTDIAVLHMNGTYAYTDAAAIERLYGDALENAVQAVQTSFSALLTAAETSPTAVWALTQLNRLEWDTRPLADLLKEDASDETVRRILSESNLTALSAVFALLYVGNGDASGASLASALAENDSLRGSGKAERLALAKRLADDWNAVCAPLTAYRNAGVSRDSDENEIAAYQSRLNDRERNDWALGSAYDAVLGETLSERFSHADLTAEDLCFVVDGMSEAQRAVAPYLGSDLLLFAGCAPVSEALHVASEKSEDRDLADLLEEMAKGGASDRVSLQTGIRSFVYASGGLALTADALAYSGENADLNWLREGEVFSETFEDFLGDLCNAFWQGTLTGNRPAEREALQADLANKAKTQAPLTCACALLGRDLSDHPAVVATLSAGAIAAMHALYDGTILYADGLPQYKVIPSAVLEIRKDTDYTVFQAVEQEISENATILDPNGDEIQLAEVAGDFADLNAWSGVQWSALYTTKDPKAGNPIYADGFCALADREQAALEHGVVRAFGERTSCNLNAYAAADTLGGLYLYFDRIQDYGERTVTTFSRLDLCLAIGGGSLGGVIIGAVAVYVAYEMKRRRAEDHETDRNDEIREEKQ